MATFMLLLSDVAARHRDQSSRSSAGWPSPSWSSDGTSRKRRLLRLIQYAALVFVMLPVMLAVIVSVAYAL
jgi:hypothetical protein